MRRSRTLFLLMLMSCAMPSLAVEKNSSEQLYKQAINEVRSENYSAALNSIEAAQQAGYSDPKLYYNKGVILYKLNRYQEAKQAFLKAGDSAIVIYNQGLVEYRLGDMQAAKERFITVQKMVPDSRLSILSTQMIERMDNDNSRKKDKPWHAVVDVSMGYDNNVTLENTELAQASNKEDMYMDVYASAKYDLQSDLSVAFGITAMLYETEDAYDYTQYNLSLLKKARLGDWSTRLMGRVERANLGGNDYMQKYSVRTQAAKMVSDRQLVRAYYDLSIYEELDAAYSHLSGLRHRVKVDTRWRSGELKYRVGYDLELNDREDLTTYNPPNPTVTKNFTSYSATRHSLMAEVGMGLTRSLDGKLRLDYRTSRYNDANIVADVSETIREDDRYRVYAELRHSLSRGVHVVGSYSHIDNSSNNPAKSYQRSQVELGIQAVF